MMCSVYSCLCAYTCFGDTDLLGRFEKRTNERKDNTLIRMCVFAGLVWRDSSICFGNWGASRKTVFQTEQQFFVILFRAQMKQALHAAYLITSKFILIWIVDVDMCVCDMCVINQIYLLQTNTQLLLCTVFVVEILGLIFIISKFSIPRTLFCKYLHRLIYAGK